MARCVVLRGLAAAWPALGCRKNVLGCVMDAVIKERLSVNEWRWGLSADKQRCQSVVHEA